MPDQIVPQVEEEVKCSLEGCDENVFRDDLCFDCFKTEQDMAWDDHADEIAQAHAVSVGRG